MQRYRYEVLQLAGNIHKHRFSLCNQMKRMYYILSFVSAFEHVSTLPALHEKWQKVDPLFISMVANKLSLQVHLKDAQHIIYLSNLHATLFAFRLKI